MELGLAESSILSNCLFYPVKIPAANFTVTALPDGSGKSYRLSEAGMRIFRAVRQRLAVGT
jgi:hypothetical protein